MGLDTEVSGGGGGISYDWILRDRNVYKANHLNIIAF